MNNNNTKELQKKIAHILRNPWLYNDSCSIGVNDVDSPLITTKILEACKDAGLVFFFKPSFNRIGYKTKEIEL